MKRLLRFIGASFFAIALALPTMIASAATPINANTTSSHSTPAKVETKHHFDIKHHKQAHLQMKKKGHTA